MSFIWISALWETSANALNAITGKNSIKLCLYMRKITRWLTTKTGLTTPENQVSEASTTTTSTNWI